MLTKNVRVTVKSTAADDTTLEDGQFIALASIFGNVDDVGDVVLPGAFVDDLKAWRESGDVIPLYWAHRMDDPMLCIGSVVDATETDTGLQVKAELDLENKTAAQVYRLLKGRRVNRMSFAYDVLDGGPAERDDASVYELRKLKIHEVSVVQVPANPEATVLDVKRTPHRGSGRPKRVTATDLRARRSRVKAAATTDADLTALLGQADQAIDNAEDAIADADAAMDAVFVYLGLDDTDEATEGQASRGTATKTGRTLSGKNEQALRGALDKFSAGTDAVKSVLASINDSNDGKASPTQPTATEEPDGAKADESARPRPASLRLRTGLAALAAEVSTLTD